MSIFYYSAYNLVIQSPVTLPLLSVAFPEATMADITIRYDLVSPKGLLDPLNQGVTYQATGTEFWLHLPSIGRFLVSHGQDIIICPADGIDEDSIRAFLLSTCFEILLRQRQLIVMQGYVLKRANYGVAFSGAMGKGQSLLQGLFYKRKQAFLASNFFALNHDAMVLPGMTQLEFWPSVISALGLTTDSLKTLRPRIKKYILPLEQRYYAKSLPLHVLYTWKMHQHRDILFSELDASNKQPYLQQLLQANTLSATLCQDKNAQQVALERLQHIEIVCIHVPETGLKLPQLADSIERDLERRGHCYV